MVVVNSTVWRIPAPDRFPVSSGSLSDPYAPLVRPLMATALACQCLPAPKGHGPVRPWNPRQCSGWESPLAASTRWPRQHLCWIAESETGSFGPRQLDSGSQSRSPEQPDRSRLFAGAGNRSPVTQGEFAGIVMRHARTLGCPRLREKLVPMPPNMKRSTVTRFTRPSM